MTTDEAIDIVIREPGMSSSINKQVGELAENPTLALFTTIAESEYRTGVCLYEDPSDISAYTRGFLRLMFCLGMKVSDLMKTGVKI
jgi:hypothetical protein